MQYERIKYPDESISCRINDFNDRRITERINNYEDYTTKYKVYAGRIGKVCDHCEKSIPVGSPSWNVPNEDYTATYHFHEKCYEFVDKFSNMDEYFTAKEAFSDTNSFEKVFGKLVPKDPIGTELTLEEIIKRCK